MHHTLTYVRRERHREHKHEEKAKRYVVDSTAPVDLGHWARDERPKAQAQNEKTDTEDGDFFANMELPADASLSKRRLKCSETCPRVSTMLHFLT